MLRCLPIFTILTLVLIGCSGAQLGKVKGRLVKNGQALDIAPGTQAAVMAVPLGADGQPDKSKVYTMMIDPDGSFELFASGAQLPSGKYHVTLDISGELGKETKSFSTTMNVQPGQNEILLDLAKSE